MNIHLPNSAFLGNIDAFIAKCDLSHPDTLEITANQRWISIHPAVLAMVVALGLTAKKVQCVELEAKSKHYLERMRLFKLLNINAGMTITEHEPAGRFIPLTQITDSAGLTKFITEIVPLLHLDARHATPIKYVVSELIRNVLEHAQTPHGAIVAAQYYVKSNTIRIGIADTGIGIHQAITQSHTALTHVDAIRLALTPGITGTTRKEGGTEHNAGAGLFFIKSIAKVNKDFFVLYSGNAMYKLLRSKEKKVTLQSDPYHDKHTVKKNLPFLRGTVVGIDMNLDTDDDFTELLENIRNVYTEAIRERKKKKYVKPRFI